MEQAQLSELLMQITRLNKLDIIFLHPHRLPAHAFPSRLWEGGVFFYSETIITEETQTIVLVKKLK